MAVGRTITVPARAARLITLKAGARVRIVDLEGCQCVDFWALVRGDLTRWASAEHTRVEVGRLFPAVGEHIYTNRREPMLLFEADSSPGVHDMLVAACDPPRFHNLGVVGWHASCEENFFTAAAQVGWQYPFLPQSISWFTNIPIDSERRIGWEPAVSSAGDAVTLQTLMECHIIVCSCSQDIVPINGGRPTPLAVELLDDEVTDG